MRLNKERVRLRFARAAATYDSQAVVQLQVADKLLSLLKKHILHPPSRILEIGCCTGLLTARVHELFKKAEAFYVNDLVSDFQAGVRERVGNDPRLTFLSGDIEQLEIPKGLDLIVSSSTLHWLEDLPSLFRKFETSLEQGGLFCFSIYGTENLAEVRKITGIGLDYSSLADLKNLVENSFDIQACEEEKITLHFDDALAMLNHLRETGVNALDTQPWTRSQLEKFTHEYMNHFGNQGQVPLTYHPIYCVGRKR